MSENIGNVSVGRQLEPYDWYLCVSAVVHGGRSFDARWGCRALIWHVRCGKDRLFWTEMVGGFELTRILFFPNTIEVTIKRFYVYHSMYVGRNNIKQLLFDWVNIIGFINHGIHLCSVVQHEIITFVLKERVHEKSSGAWETIRRKVSTSVKKTARFLNTAIGGDTVICHDEFKFDKIHSLRQYKVNHTL